MQLVILYIITFVVLLAVEVGYIPLARKNKWSTERNRRADGHPVTVIGGGIIFYIAMVMWCLAMGVVFHQSEVGANFIVGLTMVAACSFADDLMQLKVWIRLVVQFVAVTFLGLQCNIFEEPCVIWPMFMLSTVGFINAYNFMDGINGITAAYSISVLGFFLYLNTFQIHFISGSLILMALISLFIFALFNYRKRARVFAGDVGSITMGFIVATVLIYYILATHTLTPLIFVSVYGVDTFLTVLRRASEGENIFKPHRKHIYQLLNYVWRCSQLSIASGYAIVQLLISIFYLQLHSEEARVIYCVVVVATLTALYFILMMASENKRRLIEARKQRFPRPGVITVSERNRKQRRSKKSQNFKKENTEISKELPAHKSFNEGNWN